MELLIKDVKGVYGAGACNFCSRHKLSKNSTGLEYPYDTVIEINSLSASMRACEDCFNDLISSIPFKKTYAPTTDEGE